jgi:hypothetical protein
MDDIVELSAAECRDLLETDTVGRVAFVTPGGPRIVPVNYALHEDAIEMRTTAYSELGVYGPGHEIAFEIDQLDGVHRRGWSVVAHGVCERLEQPGSGSWTSDRPADAPRPEPWAGGVRPLWLRLPWRELTGRRVGDGHWPHPVVSGRGRGY